ncbi:hypothetical protein BD413DRAFT_574706 [Trametes elegans]|nr:hypothetical protein BD413DRAFT_574706 [Trametes elegans]
MGVTNVSKCTWNSESSSRPILHVEGYARCPFPLAPNQGAVNARTHASANTAKRHPCCAAACPSPINWVRTPLPGARGVIATRLSADGLMGRGRSPPAYARARCCGECTHKARSDNPVARGRWRSIAAGRERPRTCRRNCRRSGQQRVHPGEQRMDRPQRHWGSGTALWDRRFQTGRSTLRNHRSASACVCIRNGNSNPSARSFSPAHRPDLEGQEQAGARFALRTRVRSLRVSVPARVDVMLLPPSQEHDRDGVGDRRVGGRSSRACRAGTRRLRARAGRSWRALCPARRPFSEVQWQPVGSRRIQNIIARQE